MASEASLHGLLVADFSRVLAGPLAAMTLGDLGADVIKVEGPLGDDTRHWGPPYAEDGSATYFLAVNRNKRSVRLDMRDDHDRTLARTLLSRADIVIENFRPGVMERLGVGWSEARETNRRLIWCSISGFGREAGAALAGYDAAVQAMSGLMSVTGDADGPPFKVGVAVVDVLAGLNAVTGILAALHARDRGADGQRVDISLMTAALSGLANHASGFLAAGEVPARAGNAHVSIEPYATFPTADGELMICVGNDKQWRALCAATERPDWAQDAELATNGGRVRHRDRLRPMLSTVLARADRAHWVTLFAEWGIPCGPVNDLAEAFETAAGLGLDPVVDHAGFRSVRSPIELSATPTSVVRPPPRLDEHGDAIREWLARPQDETVLAVAVGASPDGDAHSRR